MPPPEAICQNIEPDLPIPDSDPEGVTYTVNLSDSGTITDLDVCINASHTWPGDLYVTLTHDSGTTVVLMNRPGGPIVGCNVDDIWAYLDDSATLTTNDECPVVGDLMPYEPLSAFNGQSVSGTWTLKVEDQLAFDTGYLTGFSMTFQTGTPAPTPTPTATPIPSVTPTPTATPTPTPTVSPTSAPSPTPTPVPPSCPTSPLSIPDNNPGGVDRALGLGGTGTIQDLDVCITITHNWPGNLKVTLTRETTEPPETTTVVLMDRPGILNPSYQAGCPNTNPGYPLGTPMSVAILFDDEAADSVTDTCPLVGPLRPQDALSAFDNKTRAATWTLRVYDLVAGDTGTLTGFALNFTLNPTPTP